ncbi:MAG TPA: DUF2442 domain-containing protein [Candidatus Eremiobacteraeota bacterium]|nr:MAG: hypothetical protein BWY64_01735 [bacterium ADurb.Bin363]HPZ07055.1 DUF2442 domain-containing protein [Candidatus Eremiobacteraeota bacterium]
MYSGVKEVQPLPDYELLLTFENNEKRIFDMKPCLNKGLFKQLKDISLFNSVHVSFDTIQWDNGLDLCPEFLYTESISYTEKIPLKVQV